MGLADSPRLYADPLIETTRVLAADPATFAYAASLSATDVQSDLEARSWVPVCVATLALDGELHAAGFLPDGLARPEVAALARRVDLREDARFTASLPRERPTSVTVMWKDGDTTSAHVRSAKATRTTP